MAIPKEQIDLKAELLSTTVEHVDITKIDARAIIDAMAGMSFTSRDLARATGIFNEMVAEEACSVILTIAGSTSAGGCMQLYADLVRYNMVDAIVATGASIVDMDFFEALGFRHYQAQSEIDDQRLRELYIDRIYDTYIDENDLQACDRAIADIANGLAPRPYSSREFIREMGRWMVSELGVEVPIHFSRFTPMYKLRDLPPTPVETLRRARETALDAGLQYVYTGNVPGDPGEDTFCPKCGRMVIDRYGYRILRYDVVDGKCGFCGEAIYGLF